MNLYWGGPVKSYIGIPFMLKTLKRLYSVIFSCCSDWSTQDPPLGVRFFVLVGILLFLWLKSPCKNSEPYDNPFWAKKVRGREEKKNNEKLITWAVLCPNIGGLGLKFSRKGKYLDNLWFKKNLRNVIQATQILTGLRREIWKFLQIWALFYY